MNIAIECNGDWNDANVSEAQLEELLAAGVLRDTRTNTADLYNEADSRPVYTCDEFPKGLNWLPLDEQAA